MRVTSRTKFAAVAIVLAFALFAAGCSSGSESGDAGGSKATSTQGATGSTSGSASGFEVSNAVNALDLKGPSTVPETPEVEPLATGTTPNLPTTFTDSRGRSVEITKADRIIALDLYSTLTDTVIGLGLSDRLVGRAKSDTQPSLSELPVVSQNGLDLNAEAVLNLHPDVILTNLTIGSERIYESLESAGVKVVRFENAPEMANISTSIEQVGAVFGVQDLAKKLAERVESELRDAQKEIEALAAETPRKPRAIVVYVRGNGGIFFIFGPGYGASDVIKAVGLDDVAGSAGVGDLVPANAEAFISMDPEIILTMEDALDTAGGVDGLLARSGVAQTVAGKSQRIIVAADNQLLAYGPRTPANLLALARVIYTDASGG